MVTSIDTAQRRDVRTMWRLLTETFTMWHRNFADYPAISERVLRSPDNGWHFLAAHTDDEFAGFAVLKPNQNLAGQAMPETLWGELLYVAVAPAHRGQGIGVALIGESERLLRDTGRLGIMATINDSTTGLYANLDWAVGNPGDGIFFPDYPTGRHGHQAWQHPADVTYPRWAWKSLDPQRPVMAWTLPDGRKPPLTKMKAALRRQAGYTTDR